MKMWLDEQSESFCTLLKSKMHHDAKDLYKKYDMRTIFCVKIKALYNFLPVGLPLYFKVAPYS